VLLHWAPASGRLYEPVMPLFAGGGLEAIAFDLPGYGRSYKADKGFSVEDMATAILAGMDALGHRRFHLLGGHLSASVTAQIGVQAPERIRSLTLDGVLLLEPQEWTALLARFAGKSPMPKGNPDYRAFPFEMTLETLREWNPDFVLTDDSLGEVYALLNDYMEMGLPTMRAFVEPDENAPPPYDLEPTLRRLAVPTLLLSAEREPLRASFDRATKLIGGAIGHSFEGTHPLVTKGAAERYAARVLAHIVDR
jgi:pimeloyl-ACP methyl ester carboxylesterase